MGELATLRIESVSEADRVGEPVDALPVASKEVPTLCPAIATIGPRVADLLFGRQFGRFARIKTDGDHLIVTANLQRHRLTTFEESVEHLGAEHRAAIVDQGQHNWLLAKVVA